MYTFVQIDPRRDAAHFTEEQWGRMLGVEVTEQRYAALCRQGNVDPQHGMHMSRCRHPHGHHTSEPPLHGGPCTAPEWPAITSSDAACSYALRMPLPPDYTIFATVRPDVDSIAAMAVLVLRSLGFFGGSDPSSQLRELHAVQSPGIRIRHIAERDGFTPGAEWVPRPLPTVDAIWPTTVATVEETATLAPLGVICSPAPGQMAHPLSTRVAIVACWLLWGDPIAAVDSAPEHVRCCWTRQEGSYTVADRIAVACGVSTEHPASTDVGATFRAIFLRASEEASLGRQHLAHALQSLGAKVRVRYYDGAEFAEVDAVSGQTLVDDRSDDDFFDPEEGIAIVDYQSRGALGVGYCVAPVVIATGLPCEGGGRKFTIAAWSAKYLDFPALVAALNVAERREADRACAVAHGTDFSAQAEEARATLGMWGGNITSGIIGSPQAGGSFQCEDEIVRCVQAHMR